MYIARIRNAVLGAAVFLSRTCAGAMKQYHDKESKMMPIIEREKSMPKALEIYNRY
jgi:hypothetical protein